MTMTDDHTKTRLFVCKEKTVSKRAWIARESSPKSSHESEKSDSSRDSFKSQVTSQQPWLRDVKIGKDSTFYIQCLDWLIVVREHRSRRRSGPRISESVSCDNEDKENMDDQIDGQPSNLKIDREIQELSKIPDSGAAKVILEQLKKKKYEHPLLDPRSASRTPNADREPTYKTRYDSPMFACMFTSRFYLWLCDNFNTC